jgi:hypothetical protein
MITLTQTELSALRNLAAKSGGAVTAFLNIADAQHLTELGLASRSRQGWDITPLGSAYLAELEGPANEAGD